MADQPSNPPNPSTTKALSFWAYFTISITLLTLLLSSLLPRPHDYRSWFFSLPDDLRIHHSKGKLIKTHGHASTRQVFAIEQGPKDGDPVLFVHGLASSSFSFRRILPPLASAGIRAVAVDLPGSGFSDPLPLDDGFSALGRPFRWIWDVYSEVREKGVFWGFEQLVETGGIPYDQIRASDLGAEDSGGGEMRYGSAEISWVLEQVIDSLELAPVHLVLHDSALVPGLSLVGANRGLVRSVSLIDSAAGFPAFPSLILGVPVVGRVVMSSQYLFSGLLRLCCSRSMDAGTAEAYRLMVRGKEGRNAVVAAGKALNLSFDLAQWGQSELAGDIPIQVLWSNMWSDRWIDEGKKVVSDLPMANFSHHSGGRWPQEDASEEIADKILEFVLSLPKLTRPPTQESQSHQTENLVNDPVEHDHFNHHNHHFHGLDYGHEYGANFGLVM